MKHEELGEMTEKDKENMRSNLKQEVEELQEQINTKEDQIKEIENQMSSIKQSVIDMVELFKQSHFFLAVAHNMQYDEETHFNENNVTHYLAEVEEYISLLITYIAYRQENPDAAVSALSLEKMIHKDFEKGPTNVSFPSC